jgi:predicted ATPase
MHGYPDRATRLSDQKDAEARRLGQPFDIGWALTWGAYVFDYQRDHNRLLARAEEADHIAREQSIPVLYNALVPMNRGLGLLRQGRLPEAIASLRRGIDGWRARGGQLNLPYLKSALAEALTLQGDAEAGFRLVEESLEQIERSGWRERAWLPETLRLKGWIRMQQGRRPEAEAELRASIEWARRQHARSWQLRSSTTLAQLLAESGQIDAARDVLAPIYAWFTEGFDTYDLTSARAVLDDIG